MLLPVTSRLEPWFSQLLSIQIPRPFQRVCSLCKLQWLHGFLFCVGFRQRAHFFSNIYQYMPPIGALSQKQFSFTGAVVSPYSLSWHDPLELNPWGVPLWRWSICLSHMFCNSLLKVRRKHVTLYKSASRHEFRRAVQHLTSKQKSYQYTEIQLLYKHPTIQQKSKYYTEVQPFVYAILLLCIHLTYYVRVYQYKPMQTSTSPGDRCVTLLLCAVDTILFYSIQADGHLHTACICFCLFYLESSHTSNEI